MNDTPTQDKNYQVLARKYRPMSFDDMIGQNAMVKTLTNAFKTGRVAHAFMLTGVRGIGKTTTARLLARALNFEAKDGSFNGPSVSLEPAGVHCEAINNSAHMDVMEMDAASRTGVGDIREILDSVRYGPVSARYKIYIIDEVHMLSTAAFNALLKTLEEPPDHAKFIFATTEIRKIPITVLSRCQRFDLRRIEADELAAHLGGIATKEKANVDPDGLAMIARAAEGSVRDGLSLLDQAIVQAEGDSKDISADMVRDMLGLADRGRVFDLFSYAVGGKNKEALVEARSQYHDGADPSIMTRDLLDICHDVSRAKILGQDGVFDAAPDHIARLHDLAKDLSLGDITRYWQILLKSYEDVRMAPDPLAAVEMAIVRLCVASELPSPELAAQVLKGLQNLPDAPQNAPQGRAEVSTSSSRGSETMSSDGPPPNAPLMSHDGSGAVLQLEPTPSIPTDISGNERIVYETFEALVDSMSGLDSNLRYDVRQYVRLAQFETGKIIFNLSDNAPDRIEGRLRDFVTTQTQRPWEVRYDSDATGQPSLREQEKQAKQLRENYEMSHPMVQKAKELFPGVEIVFRDRDPISNVIEADFKGAPDPSDKR